MSDNEINEEAHEKLIENIQKIGSKNKRNSIKLKKHNAKIGINDLLQVIHSTKNIDIVRKELRNKKKSKVAQENKTLSTPLHRQLRDRIEGDAAYSQIRQEFDEWVPLVKQNRLAEQLVFPLNSDEIFNDNANQRLESFTPRTPLEKEMDKLLSTSKSNLTNDVTYTEAELEILRAMNLDEMRAKCAQLRKMRALLGYHQAKLKRQSKIKSKSYHRHMRLRKHKQLIKEFDELLVKDPEKAKEKLVEIERQRIRERATLKHRNGSKKIQQLSRYASRNPEVKRFFEEQIRLGRTLTEKHGGGGISDTDESDDDNNNKKFSSHDLLQRAADLVERKERIETMSTNPHLKDRLKEMREEKKQHSAKLLGNMDLQEKLEDSNSTKMAESIPKTKQWEENDIWDDNQSNQVLNAETTSQNLEKNDETNNGETSKEVKSSNVKRKQKKLGKSKKNSSKKSKRNSAKKVKTEHKNMSEPEHNGKSSEASVQKVKRKSVAFAQTVDQIFDNIENKLLRKKSKKKKKKSGCGALDAFTSVASNVGKRKANLVPTKESPQNSTNIDHKEADISLDPKHFLQVETNKILQIPGELVDKMDEIDAEMEQEVIAEAFKDDDLIADFAMDKAATEEAEKPKDIDLTLQGWGSWTGPGIEHNKKNDRFVIKAAEQKRKDRGMAGVIISEAIDKSIEKLQPNSVPFPYTTVKDYEAVLRQPIGKEWNPQRVFKNLIRPAIRIKAGKIIKPMKKSVLLENRVNGSIELGKKRHKPK